MHEYSALASEAWQECQKQDAENGKRIIPKT